MIVRRKSGVFLSFYLAATNEFNFTSVKYSHQHMETVQQARQNIPLAEFKERDYERLEQELGAYT